MTLPKINSTNVLYRRFGTQSLPIQTVSLGAELDFSVPQNIFAGISTNFVVTQNGNLVSESDYTVTNGKITFNTLGTYSIKMTNTAIVADPGYPTELIFDVTVTEVVGISTQEVSTPLSKVVDYYSVWGAKLPQEPASGIYIILYDNGKTGKIVK